MKLKMALARIVMWFFSNPIIKAVIMLIPILWNIIFIQIWGQALGLVNVSRAMTSIGERVTLIVYAVFVIYIITTGIFSHNCEIREKNHSKLSGNVLQRNLQLYAEKLDKLQESFLGFVDGKNNLKIEYDVDKRINTILMKLRNLIGDFSNIEPDNISAALFYRFDSGKWHRLSQEYSDAFGGDEITISHRHSFAQYIMSESKENPSKRFYFLNDKFVEGVCHKVDGIVKPRYTLNPKDEKFKKHGSIAGIIFSLSIGNKYIEALLFISTYGKKIDNSLMEMFREDVEKNLEKVIMPSYEMNLTTELIYLYAQGIQRHENLVPS